MGNCSGKQSKHDKKLAKEDVYKSSKKNKDIKKGQHNNRFKQGKNVLEFSTETTSKAKDSDFKEIKVKEIKNNENNGKNISKKVPNAVEQIVVEKTPKVDTEISPSAMDINRSNTSNNFTNKKRPNVENSQNDNNKSVDSAEFETTNVTKTEIQKTNMAVGEVKSVQDVKNVDSVTSANKNERAQASAYTSTAETPAPRKNKFEDNPYLFAQAVPNEAPEQEEKVKKPQRTYNQLKDTTGNNSNITSDMRDKMQQTKAEHLSNNFVTMEKQNQEKMSVITGNTEDTHVRKNEGTRTGYDNSKFAEPEKPGKELVKEHVAAGSSEHLKDKKKKKKKKKDPCDPPSDFKGNVYEYVSVMNIGCENVIINKPEKPKEVEEEFEPTYTISVQTMTILAKVSKTVGYIQGSLVSGTCWRAGRDKIITAAHVVKDNLCRESIQEFHYEPELNHFCVNFNYVEEKQEGSVKFEVEPKVIFIDESLDVAVLQLKNHEQHEFPSALETFIKLNPKKDTNKEIFLISHNKGESKGINGKIGIWTPTEERMTALQKFCEEYGQSNGYADLDKKDRLVLKCDFIGGASGSPGITLLNGIPHVVLIYIRGFPDFYYAKNFPETKKKTFPENKLFQQGTCICAFYDKLARNIPLRDEIFPIGVKYGKSNTKQEIAIAGDITKNPLKGSACSEAANIVVVNPSHIHNPKEEPSNDPGVVQQTSKILISGNPMDIVCNMSDAVENRSSYQNVHSSDNGGTHQTQVQDEDVGQGKFPINPDEFTS